MNPSDVSKKKSVSLYFLDILESYWPVNVQIAAFTEKSKYCNCEKVCKFEKQIICIWEIYNLEIHLKTKQICYFTHVIKNCFIYGKIHKIASFKMRSKKW